MTVDQWRRCYADGWRGIISDESFAHPAKMAKILANRIYDHAFERGWVKAGDCVLDPFGGIGGTAYGAILHDLQWIGVELEPKFVAMAKKNIERWVATGRECGFPNGNARIVQGDSRRLVEVLRDAGELPSPNVVISSPPYAGIEVSPGNSGNRMNTETWGTGSSLTVSREYGKTDGQLGNMREGQAPALVVSSPPYASIATGAGGLNTKPGTDGQQSGRSASAPSQATDQRYGSSDGQLAVMAEGDVAAIVSSPPFEGIRQDGGGIAKEGKHFGAYTDEPADYWHTQRDQQNLGNLKTGDTFWQSAAEIVEQCYAILKPGGVAIWVTKDFVRKGKRVPFGDQWQALCESRGSVLECRHHAMLVEHHGEQDDLFSETKVLKTERKSFFRRLHESKKGAVRIDWEDVICVRKPL